jgi:hypothetical protein
VNRRTALCLLLCHPFSYTHEVPYGWHLEPAHKRSDETLTEETYKQFLGKKEKYPELLDFFDQEEHKLGPRKLVEKYGPQLVPGVAAALTHGIIHAGWALDAYRRGPALQAGGRWMLIEGVYSSQQQRLKPCCCC